MEQVYNIANLAEIDDMNFYYGQRVGNRRICETKPDWLQGNYFSNMSCIVRTGIVFRVAAIAVIQERANENYNWNL